MGSASIPAGGPGKVGVFARPKPPGAPGACPRCPAPRPPPARPCWPASTGADTGSIGDIQMSAIRRANANDTKNLALIDEFTPTAKTILTGTVPQLLRAANLSK